VGIYNISKFDTDILLSDKDMAGARKRSNMMTVTYRIYFRSRLDYRLI